MAREYTFDYDIFSDIYKEAYGFRPRGHRFYAESTTDEERQAIWDSVMEDQQSAYESECKREREAMAEFEKAIKDIQNIVNCGREQAIFHYVESLQLDSVDLRYGGDRVCYEVGLPFSMAEVFEDACNELRKMEDA